ncbi:MAG: cation:proton antiporter, partial [Butyricicoccus pullicaecorum]|nr:cation:proton antiporter [Butyricicoccus pullicaecorum]
MQSYEFLLIIAVILLSTKVFGLISERVHMPQVVGALLAGVVLGPSVLGLVQETDFLLKTSEIGVIILMFMAGLDTDLEELKKTGVASFVIALIGVVVPLAAGTVLYLGFFPDTGDPLHMLKALFIGVVLTATSVSITVETLREMGKLKGKVGTAILGAAIIDDIMGIVVLTLVSGMTDPSVNLLSVIARIAAFFVVLVVVGLVMYRLFRAITREWSNH